MRFLCRTDASLFLGTGHVVRCCTLATQLVQAGHEFRFLCRDDTGNLNNWLETQGFQVTRLTQVNEQDAAECQQVIEGQHYDWLIVDHYGLGAAWEQAMATVAVRTFVIDDLGREHSCNLLLDQNYRTCESDLYQDNVPKRCELLLGPDFALVRPEFMKLRPKSLARPRNKLARIFVFMSGTDPLNETTKVLNGIASVRRSDIVVDVVIGGNNPNRHTVEAVCSQIPNAKLHVQTLHMAEIMAAADCAIGAGGSATWERCTLGLPALVTILADNQAPIAEAVASAGGHRVLGWHNTLTAEDYANTLRALDGNEITQMSNAAAAICDGNGTARVVSYLLDKPAPNLRIEKAA